MDQNMSLVKKFSLIGDKLIWLVNGMCVFKNNFEVLKIKLTIRN